MNKYRKDFPFFKAIDEKSSVENKDLIYFDTAATAQRPFIVLNAMTHFYATENANPLRGLYSLSERATLAYENARKTVADFINAKAYACGSKKACCSMLKEIPELKNVEMYSAIKEGAKQVPKTKESPTR